MPFRFLLFYDFWESVVGSTINQNLNLTMNVQCNYSYVIPLLTNNIVDEAAMTSQPVDIKSHYLRENTNDLLSIHWDYK